MSGYHDGSLEEQEERREKMRELQERIDREIGRDATPAARARLEMAIRTAERPGSLAEQKRGERQDLLLRRTEARKYADHEARAGAKLVGIISLVILAVVAGLILLIAVGLSASEIEQGDTIAVGYMIVRVADYEDPDGLNLTLWRPSDPQPLVGPPAELKRSSFSTWMKADEISVKSPAFWIATAATIGGAILIYQLHLTMEGSP